MNTINFDEPIRAVPLWLLRAYLEELGGTLEGDYAVRGPDWYAYLTQLHDYEVGSLRIGQVYIAFEGDINALQPIREGLTVKLQTRGGG
ncbi:DUF1952 domain-containing protein [Candidatus Chloroploca sp. M-50]|uniref:DUF1952 domain-containing protein n=1 Tax=Candidatus Chloroploca mongolica TaxID=2528176 RepID=A0ABS4D3V2_9CHLR|nr:DUF1952 domain-containing protein [Candidatus Chloroploca mongolica]MBP1464123.1 DUF1952 domain-containing protein [Candidatus Chloroploca mongolica]